MVYRQDLRENHSLMPISELSGDRPLQEHYLGEVRGILIPYRQIRERVDQIARRLCAEHRESKALFVYLREGSRRFADELANSIAEHHSPIRFAPLPLTAKSYHGNSSTGNVVIDESELKVIRNHLYEDREISEVVLIEDIVDTGLTMMRVVHDVLALREQPELSVSICTLLDKPSRRLEQCGGVSDFIKYSGFTIPNLFVIGFGLDYNDRFREMDHIGVPTDEAITKYA